MLTMPINIIIRITTGVWAGAAMEVMVMVDIMAGGAIAATEDMEDMAPMAAIPTVVMADTVMVTTTSNITHIDIMLVKVDMI